MGTVIFKKLTLSLWKEEDINTVKVLATEGKQLFHL